MTRSRSIIAAAAIAMAMAGNAQAQQSRTLTVSGYANVGAIAALANVGSFTTSAGGFGQNVYANATVNKFVGQNFSDKFASSLATADVGRVLSATTTPFGNAESGASGLGVAAWSGGSTFVFAGGKRQSLDAGASAEHGGAWTSVQALNWYGLSVGAGDGVTVRSKFSN